MIESTPAVPIRAMLGMSSMARVPRNRPSVMPLDMMRAAVRWVTLMPSPMKRMTLRACRGPVVKTSQITVAVLLPSVATTVCQPGFVSTASRRSQAEASTPSSLATNWPGRPRTVATSTPSMVSRASLGAMTRRTRP
jgi:hypothetical protein